MDVRANARHSLKFKWAQSLRTVLSATVADMSPRGSRHADQASQGCLPPAARGSGASDRHGRRGALRHSISAGRNGASRGSVCVRYKMCLHAGRHECLTGAKQQKGHEDGNVRGGLDRLANIRKQLRVIK